MIVGGKFRLETIRQLNHLGSNREGEVNVSAGITFISPMPQVVYTGDEDGRVVSLAKTPVQVCTSDDDSSTSGIVFNGIEFAKWQIRIRNDI